jgi:hypothetical protein
MSVLPPKCDPVLLVDPNAVSTHLIALQQLKAIPGRHHEIIQTTGRINQPHLSLHDTPNRTRDSASGPSISLAKQIGGCFVGEGLNHTSITRYTYSM